VAKKIMEKPELAEMDHIGRITLEEEWPVEQIPHEHLKLNDFNKQWSVKDSISRMRHKRHCGDMFERCPESERAHWHLCGSEREVLKKKNPSTETAKKGKPKAIAAW